MPPVRNVQFNSSQIQIIDKNGTKTLLVSAIPAAQNTVAKVESWINTTWAPANFTDYQVQVHIFSIAPFSCSVWTGNLGLPIPANWWS